MVKLRRRMLKKRHLRAVKVSVKSHLAFSYVVDIMDSLGVVPGRLCLFYVTLGTKMSYIFYCRTLSFVSRIQLWRIGRCD